MGAVSRLRLRVVPRLASEPQVPRKRAAYGSFWPLTATLAAVRDACSPTLAQHHLPSNTGCYGAGELH